MKNIYVILAFHAHELLWDLPEMLLASLDEKNPMKDTILDENYMKKRKEEGRDIYSRSLKFAENLNAPLCVEYTNELLFQIKDVVPDAFKKLKEGYAKGQLYPIYGHAHHTHVSLLQEEEIIQEIQWNKQYLHSLMDVPYPKYNGLFSSEASYDYAKIEAIEKANIDYVIFPHLNELKAPFKLKGPEGYEYKYKPFFIKTEHKNILALPRNFPISQEIWRPITKMEREEVKFQGYMLGIFPVFDNEYLYGDKEKFPITLEEGVEIYKGVLRKELECAPPGGVLVHIQDLELMDFGDIALEIMEKAWRQILRETAGKLNIHFVTPDQYIDEVLKNEGMGSLPEIEFGEISWAPEIRLILRADGHYPPLGVTDVGRYDKNKTGLYRYPHIFWENGKYFCEIFDTLVSNFNISSALPAEARHFDDNGYDLMRENWDTRAAMFLRIMKRACNWGWRPTEGRQKRPCLKGYLLCMTLLTRLETCPLELILNRQPLSLDERSIVGIIRMLEIFIDGRINYLKYGMERLSKEREIDFSSIHAKMEQVFKWKEIAVGKAVELYETNKTDKEDWAGKLKRMLLLMRDYCQAVFLSTEHIQRLWGKIDDAEFMVEKMYEYLYDIYPPLFPSMLDAIDVMNPQQIEEFFSKQRKGDPAIV
ncbi:MAG: glycoside hydrolase [Firmicutes bacterium]|nr:glycoside hydrolase [Bacillota bacterium]